MSDFPPPYGPHHSSAAFSSSPWATAPRISCYIVPDLPSELHRWGRSLVLPWGPGPSGATGPYMNQPGYQGYQGGPSGPPGHWDYNKTQQPQATTTVVVVEQQRQQDDGGGAEEGFMAACYAAICCCCLMDMIDDLASDHSDH